MALRYFYEELPELHLVASGSLRSLHLMLETYPNCPKGIVLSTRLYDQLPEQKLRFLPLYTAATLTVTEPATSKD